MTKAISDSDLVWFGSNPPELEMFAGKYVAIYNKAVVGSGDSVAKALEGARAAGCADPLIAYVEAGGLQACVAINGEPQNIWACLGKDGKTFVGWAWGESLEEVKKNLLNSRHGEDEVERTYFVVRAGSRDFIRVLPDDYTKAIIVRRTD